MAITNGTANNDSLIGTIGADKLYSLAGNDILLGGDGNDTLVGGDGNDYLKGGAGNDYLYGGAGNDTFIFQKGDLDAKNDLGGDTIMDFQGAGVWSATSNDFIAFNGFGTLATGASLTYIGTSANLTTLQYYKVQADAAHGGGEYILTVNMAGHTSNHLSAGDYAFY